MKRQERQTLVVNVNLTRGLVALLTLALLTAALLGYLAWGREEAAASSPQAGLAASTNMRQYYLTKTYYDGANASTACAGGYHMASLWEILDPSNLEYNTTLGNTRDDIGQGPLVFYAGWVRTGYNSSSANSAGQGNCNTWTSSSPSDYGTLAHLPTDWTAGQDIHVWKVRAYSCDIPVPVWCMED